MTSLAQLGGVHECTPPAILRSEPNSRVHLDGVTLCAIESRPTSAIAAALERTMQLVTCDRAILLSSAAPSKLDSAVAFHPIERFADVRDYSAFILRNLLHYVETSHVLIIQWDGFVHNPTAWDPAFLQYDYVGAPWPHFAPPHNMGNGGFSLRSRKLLQALSDPRFAWDGGPEDVAICRHNRGWLEAEHRIRFAPAAVAARFSTEHGASPTSSFGFHGVFNFPEIFGEGLADVIGALDDFLLHNRDARTLCKKLLSSDMRKDRRLGRRFLCRMLKKTPWSKHNWGCIWNVIPRRSISAFLRRLRTKASIKASIAKY